MKTIQDQILETIKQERDRQDQKWGEQNHDPEIWVGILGEEYGEFCEAVIETVLMGDKPEKGGYEKMRKEAIHVAAVAVGILEYLERNKKNGVSC